jgi:hypothetical protein
MPGKFAPVPPCLRRRASAVEVCKLQRGQAASVAGLKGGPRLPQPGPARLNTLRVEPPRSPAFPLLISNLADAAKELRYDAPQ